jgi:polysaccharide export outer membrane protein
MSSGPRTSAEMELSSRSALAEFRLGSFFTQPGNERHSVSNGNALVQSWMRRLTERRLTFFAALLGACVLLCPGVSRSQTGQQETNRTGTRVQGETTEDYNRRLEQLNPSLAASSTDNEPGEYRIGAHDLLEINVFEAPDLNRSLRVSAGGEISMPLLGAVQSSGLTARELEGTLEVKLRQYMKDPHVGVFVTTVESHPVSVVGAVKKPGVFQIRGTKTVLEMLSMSEGLADDAGDQVLVMRGAGLHFGSDSNRSGANPDGAESSLPQSASRTQTTATAVADPNDNDTIKINLKDLFESGDQRYNVAVYPGDIVKVTRGGIVYVIGDVKKPGGFVLKTDQNMSVLKAIALAEGLNATAAKSRAKIIRTDEKTGQRTEFPIDLGKVLAGKTADTPLKPADIVFIPNSSGKTMLYKGTEAAVATASGLIIWR